MPTYDYQCRACGTVTEVIHSMLEDGPSSCDLCGGDLRRVLYPTGIIFKGSGFYRTDSRSGAAGTDGSGGSGGGSTDGAGTAAGAGTGGSDAAAGAASTTPGTTDGGSGKRGDSGGGGGPDAGSRSKSAPGSD